MVTIIPEEELDLEAIYSLSEEVDLLYFKQNRREDILCCHPLPSICLFTNFFHYVYFVLRMLESLVVESKTEIIFFTPTLSGKH